MQRSMKPATVAKAPCVSRPGTAQLNPQGDRIIPSGQGTDRGGQSRLVLARAALTVRRNAISAPRRRLAVGTCPLDTDRLVAGGAMCGAHARLTGRAGLVIGNADCVRV